MRAKPISFWVLAVITAVACVAGFCAQVLHSSYFHAVFVPPFGLPLLLVALAAVVLTLGLQIRRRLRVERKMANPFLAVRLLAASRAGQILGTGCAGFTAGLLLWLLPRLAQTATHIWLPLIASTLAGLLLAGCGVFVERCCLIPPRDDDKNSEKSATASDVLEDTDPVAASCDI
ncbi:MAG: DUF3180 domain-containing protein [Microbacteriaceae bacterium]|nr:DUF3180 domain-containing protein [Microbacteriaceae bacterium]